MANKLIEKLKTYNEITDFTGIARRYFINNFYDGMLTILGILLGFFVIILKDPSQPTILSAFILLTGLGTSISMLISGISGSYLSEKAEQKKGTKELDEAMVDYDEDDEDVVDDYLESEEKIKVKTIHEKAESFSGIIVSLVNGFSPFLGGIVPIIPFFLVANAGISTFLISFVIIGICIVFLGVFLGKISQDSMIKNILQMGFAFGLTIIISILFLG